MECCGEVLICVLMEEEEEEGIGEVGPEELGDEFEGEFDKSVVEEVDAVELETTVEVEVVEVVEVT